MSTIVQGILCAALCEPNDEAISCMMQTRWLRYPRHGKAKRSGRTTSSAVA